MKRAIYTQGGPGINRVLDPETLERLGIDLKSGLEWTPRNSHTQLVSDHNADVLAAKLPGEFTFSDPEDDSGDQSDEGDEDSDEGDSDEDDSDDTNDGDDEDD